jgi:hypothetical protein
MKGRIIEWCDLAIASFLIGLKMLKTPDAKRFWDKAIHILRRWFARLASDIIIVCPCFNLIACIFSTRSVESEGKTLQFWN